MISFLDSTYKGCHAIFLLLWLTSLSMTFSVHPGFCRCHYFILFNGWVIFHCISVLHFLYHSSVNGHLGCFHVLTIVNNDAVNIRAHVFFQIMCFSRYMPRSEIAGSYGSFVLACLVAQLCLTPRDPLDCSHKTPLSVGILQAEILEWVAISSSKESPRLRIEPVSPTSPALVGGFFTTALSGKPLW